MLRLLGTDLNGPDIARELMVSLNTMRTHTKNIYSKLGVNNRRAAVRRAEELDLLSADRSASTGRGRARITTSIITCGDARSSHPFLPCDQAKEAKEHMSAAHASTDDRHEPGRYEIRLKGHLDARWAAWFDGLSLTHESDGTTVIRGPVVDQAALHGLLSKVRDLGLPLISVTQIDLEHEALQHG